MNRLITILTLFVSMSALAVIPEKHPTDQFQIGKSSTSNDKQLLFDLGLGLSSNPALGVDSSDNLKYNFNSFSMGDGTNSTQKNFIANIGNGSTNPKIIWNQSLNQWQFSNNGTAFQSIGSGGGGGKNYLTPYVASTSSSTPNTGNGDFEYGATTGWSLGTIGTLTNGLPTGTPTFGSGASGNLSISAVSSGQIAGNYSLSYASSAATTQGNMLSSSAFFIDTEDQGKVLTTSYYYKVNSGASNDNFSGTSSNSFAWAAWDVTNSSWLVSAGNFCMNQNSGVGVCTGTFQTNSNTAQIRLVFYNANASGGATTLYLDSFSVGPQTSVLGPSVGDWYSCPVTITGTSSNPTKGTIVTDQAYCRRVGDSLQYSYNYNQSAAGSAGSGQYLFSIPAGLSIDTAKVVSALGAAMGGVGSGTFYSSGDGVFAVTTEVYDSTHLALNGAVDGHSSAISSSFGSLGNTTLRYTFFATVPIAGWSSNSVQSSDSANNIVAAKYQLTTAQSIPDATNTTLVWNSKVFDTYSAMNTSTGVYTVPVSGYYQVTATGAVSGAPAVMRFSTRKNGTLSQVFFGGGRSGSGLGEAVSDLILCTAGDTLDVQVFQNGGASTMDGTGSHNWISIQRVSGNSIVAASEKVFLMYTGNAGTSITSNTTNIDFSTKVFDSHGAFNGTTFTAPRSGFYIMNGGVHFTSAIAGLYKLIKNGSYFLAIGGDGTNSSILPRLNSAFYANAGDQFTIQVNASGTLSNDANGHYLTITSQ